MYNRQIHPPKHWYIKADIYKTEIHPPIHIEYREVHLSIHRIQGFITTEPNTESSCEYTQNAEKYTHQYYRG